MDIILHSQEKELQENELFYTSVWSKLFDIKTDNPDLITFRTALDNLDEIKSYIKKYEKDLNEIFAEYGYYKVSKYGWRKFDIEKLKPYEIPLETIEEQVRELAKILNIEIDDAYVLYVAYKMLKRTKLFVKDWTGYNFVHSFAIYDRLIKDEITMEDINWINQRLLNYSDQIREMGLDYDRLVNRINRLKLNIEEVKE
jgi:hypothetical protein